jgi:hypothetical protein
MCNGSGYFGQEGVFELYSFTDSDRELLQKLDLSGLKLELRKRKVPTLQQAALRKALDGTTSVEEVLRVSTEGAGEAKPAASTASAPAAPATATKPSSTSAKAPTTKPASKPTKS